MKRFLNSIGQKLSSANANGRVHHLVVAVCFLLLTILCCFLTYWFSGAIVGAVTAIVAGTAIVLNTILGMIWLQLMAFSIYSAIATLVCAITHLVDAYNSPTVEDIPSAKPDAPDPIFGQTAA